MQEPGVVCYYAREVKLYYILIFIYGLYINARAQGCMVRC